MFAVITVWYVIFFFSNKIRKVTINCLPFVKIKKVYSKIDNYVDNKI